MYTSRPCDQDTPEDIRKIFENIDSENKGYINIPDMIALAEENGEELSMEDALEIFRKIDPQYSGERISYEAFLKFN